MTNSNITFQDEWADEAIREAGVAHESLSSFVTSHFALIKRETEEYASGTDFVSKAIEMVDYFEKELNLVLSEIDNYEKKVGFAKANLSTAESTTIEGIAASGL